jgi:hypothetical protein
MIDIAHKRKIRVMSFLMLARSYNGLWIVKAEPKSLETFLGLAISVGTSATLIRSSIVASR